MYSSSSHHLPRLQFTGHYENTCWKVAEKSLTSPVTILLPELLLRPLRLLDPNNDSSTLLPRETTLYFREPLDLADPAPDASLLASDATNAMFTALFLVLV